MPEHGYTISSLMSLPGEPTHFSWRSFSLNHCIWTTSPGVACLSVPVMVINVFYEVEQSNLIGCSQMDTIENQSMSIGSYSFFHS